MKAEIKDDKLQSGVIYSLELDGAKGTISYKKYPDGSEIWYERDAEGNVSQENREKK